MLNLTIFIVLKLFLLIRLKNIVNSLSVVLYDETRRPLWPELRSRKIAYAQSSFEMNEIYTRIRGGHKKGKNDIGVEFNETRPNYDCFLCV